MCVNNWSEIYAFFPLALSILLSKTDGISLFSWSSLHYEHMIVPFSCFQQEADYSVKEGPVYGVNKMETMKSYMFILVLSSIIASSTSRNLDNWKNFREMV